MISKLVNIGFGNRLIAERIVSVLHPGSAPIKRMITEARGAGKIIDATLGRKCKAVLVLETDHIVLSAISPDTLAVRIEKDIDINT